MPVFSSSFISNGGSNNNAVISAQAITMATDKPIFAFKPNWEVANIRNPATNTIEVTISALPTVSNAYLTASSGAKPFSRRALKYLLKKCTVSSTTIPNVILAIRDSAIPT